jgi:superfamily II DNA or RNA helicase
MTQFSLFGPPPEEPAPEPLLEEPDENDFGHARYYQVDAIVAAEKSLATNRSALNVLATGLGKTEIFCIVAKRTQGRVLLLAHRDELVRESARRLKNITKEDVQIEKAEEYAGIKARLVSGSVQTLGERRLLRWPRDHFQLIIVDEAHRATAPSYRRVFDYFESAKILGVTATPDRSDEKALGLVFEDVPYVMDITDGIEAGYLVPVRGRQVELAEIDLEDVGTVAGDLNEGQLDEAMMKAAKGIVRKTLELEPERQGIAFMPGVAGAEYLAHCFNMELPGSAIFVCGDTDPDERRMLLDGFKDGRYKYLCNCDIATEGFDAPTASLIIQGRPTKSRNKYAQMIGRGTRVLPGVVNGLEGQAFSSARRAAIAASVKPDMMILDFVGNSGKHSLMTPEDVLGGNYSPDEVKKAKEIAKENPGDDTTEVLKKARSWLRDLARQQRVRRVEATVREFDPFTLLGVDEFSGDAVVARFGGRPPTPDVLEKLRAKGVAEDELSELSGRAANALLREMYERHKKGLATYKQMRRLKMYGLTDPELTFKQADAAMAYLAARGWSKKLDPKQLQRVVYGQ